jgi:hypothetical protein
MRVRLDASSAGESFSDGEYRAPLGEACSHLKILGQSATQAIQAFGYFLRWVARQFLCARVDLDAGNNSRIGEDPNKGSAVFSVLANRLVVQDCAADIFAEAGCGYQQFAPRTPGFLSLKYSENCNAVPPFHPSPDGSAPPRAVGRCDPNRW